MHNIFKFDQISSLLNHRLSDGAIAEQDNSLFYLKTHNNLPSSINQFQTENLVYNSLSRSSHILPYLGLYENDQKKFLVFPYIQDSLITHISEIDSQVLVDKILVPLLEALALIHEQGFIHADLKLENIRVENKSFIHPYISDFGKACIKQKFSANQLGSLAQHIPPDTTISPQFDIYSLGVIAFQILFGFDFIKKYQMSGRSFENLPESANIDSTVLNFIKKSTEVSSIERFKSCRMALNYLNKYSESNVPSIEPYSLEKYFEFYLECMRDIFIISNRSTQDFDSFIGPWGEKYYKRLQKWTESGAHLVHLTLNNDLIGICEASIDKQSQGIISSIYVRPEYRGKKYASMLEASAINFFKSHNINTAVLNVTTSNLRAIHFYKKNGWQESSEQTYIGALQFKKNI